MAIWIDQTPGGEDRNRLCRRARTNSTAACSCDVLFSLERVWSCDVYRAGDGVHRAWLARRRKFEIPLKQFVRAASRKHRDLLQLEESLFEKRNAGRVIAASQMVVNEIIDLYRYPADKIDLVRNGVPLDKFRFDPELREKSRAELKLKPDQIALLFAGSGWERKGLLFAIEAMAICKNRKLRLLVAGRGECKAVQNDTPPVLARRSRYNFSAKLQTLCRSTRLRTSSFCRQFTIRSPMPASKRWPVGYQ